MSGKTYKIFESYNVRSSCIQLELAINDPSVKYNTEVREAIVFLTMAPSKDKTISMDVVKRGGIQLFNYDEKIIMKLEKHEIAAIAKLKNPFYIRRYAAFVLDQNGNNKKDKNGKDIKYADTFIHSNPTRNSTTTLNIGMNQQDDTGIFVSTYYKQGQAFKNCIIYLNTNQTYELACSAEWALNRLYEESVYVRDDSKTDESSKKNQFSKNETQNQEVDITDIDDMFA